MKCTCGHDEYVHCTRNGGCIVSDCNCEQFTKADGDLRFDGIDWSGE